MKPAAADGDDHVMVMTVMINNSTKRTDNDEEGAVMMMWTWINAGMTAKTLGVCKAKWVCARAESTAVAVLCRSRRCQYEKSDMR